MQSTIEFICIYWFIFALETENFRFQGKSQNQLVI